MQRQVTHCRRRMLQFKPVVLAVVDPQTLVLTLTSPEASVAGGACDALEKFASTCPYSLSWLASRSHHDYQHHAFAFTAETNRSILLQLGVLDAALTILTTGQEAVRAQASCLLATLISAERAREAWRLRPDPSGYDVVVGLIAPDKHPVLQENGTSIVADLAQEYSSRIELARRGVVMPLASLLASTVPETQRSSLRALALLLHEFDNRTELGKTPGT